MSRRPDQSHVSGDQKARSTNWNRNLNMRKKIFILQLTEHWKRLSSEVVTEVWISPLEVFKTHPDMVLCNLMLLNLGFFGLSGCLQGSLPMSVIFWLCVSLKKNSFWIDKISLVPDGKLKMAKGIFQVLLSFHTCTILETFKMQYCI